MPHRWNPKVNYIGDFPMYKSNSGKFVTYTEYKLLLEENARLKVELTRAYLMLEGVIPDDNERYVPPADRELELDRGTEVVVPLDTGA